MNDGKRFVAWTTPTLFGAVVLSCVGARAADSVDYVTQIKPLLAQRCVTCHGP